MGEGWGMKRFAMILVAVGLGCAGVQAGDLGEVAGDGSLWGMDAAAVQRFFGGGEWMDGGGGTRTLRAQGDLFGGEPVGEVLVGIGSGGTVGRVQAMFYNKGDDGDSFGRAFVDRVEHARQAVGRVTGAEGVKKNVPAGSRMVDLHEWEWRAGGTVYRLDVASTGHGTHMQGEFVRLLMAPAAGGAGSGAAAATGAGRGAAGGGGGELDRATRQDRTKKRDLKENVVPCERGGVWIEGIPMVDQGDKGYCAAATMARLLGYYGLGSLDQHELAAAMGTKATGGTSSTAISEAMETCGKKFGLHSAVIDELEAKDYEKLMAEYNKAAKKTGVEKFVGRGAVIYAGDAFWGMVDGPTLLAAREEPAGKRKLWLGKVKKWVDQGVPVLWSVYCGLVEEEHGAGIGRGGHLRMIVGYDEGTEKVFYSDTWGKGHECKAMKVGDAMAITRRLSVLVPK